MTPPEPNRLDYAGPPAARRSVRRGVVVAGTGLAFAAVAVVCLPRAYGSGTSRPNPLAAVAAALVWLVGVAYIWVRLAEDRPRSWVAAGLAAACATIAAVAVPLQVCAWQNDPGFPQSRFRPALLGPGLVAAAALAGAALALWRLNRPADPIPVNSAPEPP